MFIPLRRLLSTLSPNYQRQRPTTRLGRKLHEMRSFAGLENLEARKMLSAAPLDPILQGALSTTAPVASLTAGVGTGGTIATAEATPVASSTYTIDNPADVDMFAVNLQAGEQLTVTVAIPTGSSLDSYLRLINSAGRPLAVNNNGAAPGQTLGKGSYLTFTATTSGLYYLGVSAYGNVRYNAITGAGVRNGLSTGAYTLTVATETDTTISQAHPIALASSLTDASGSTISSPADVDMFAVDLQAGEQVTASVGVATSSGLDSYLRLFNSAGRQLAANHNGAAPGQTVGKGSYLTFTATAAGVYYLGVSAYGNGGYSALNGYGAKNGTTDGAYTLTVATETDTTISQANPVTLSNGAATVSGDGITSPADVDVFAVNLQAGEQLTAAANIPTGSGLDSYLRLFNAAGRQLAANHYGAAPRQMVGKGSYLTYTATTAGTYYLGVSAYGNNGYSALTGAGIRNGSTDGAYTLTVATETDTTISGANQVTSTSGTADLTGYQISSLSDVDVFAVNLAAGDVLTLNVNTPAGGTLDSYLRLFNSSGKQLAANDNAAAPGEALTKDSYLSFTASTAGVYYVGISSHGNQRYNAVTGAGTANGTTAGAYELDVTVTGVTPTPTPTPTPSPTPTPTDWASQNLHDAGLISLIQNLDADGSLSRSDMINLLTSTTTNGTISSTELTDLRTIVANPTTLGIANYVDALASYIVNGNTANAHYQGATLGNLYAGSSGTQMMELVDKWFYGSDHPLAQSYDLSTTFTYQQAAGPLFSNGANMTDIAQGNVGDCYLIATLGSVAKSDPTAIQNMFVDNGDGTWTVRLYNNGVANYVTVDRMLPTYSWGGLAFDGNGASVSSTSTELWVALAEKAYVQMNEMGWQGHGNQNSYQAIDGGWMAPVYAEILGHSASTLYSSSASMASIVNAFNAGQMITVGTTSNPGYGVVGGHAYILSGYDAATQTFSLYNPWGYNHVSGLTWSQLQSSVTLFTLATA